MKRWVSYAIVVMLLAGCSTAVKRPDVTSGPVVPGADEMIIVNQAMVIVDSSSSMRVGKIREAKALAESLFEVMPDGDYQTAMIAFGGDGRRVYEFESPFVRETWAGRASAIPYIGGKTPLELSLETTYSMLSGAEGRTAVILISDGQPTIPDAAMESARKIAGLSSTQVCFYTIHIGNDADGQNFLNEIANLTDCGGMRTGESLLDGAALRDFVREVFIGKKPVVEPPKAPEPKDSDGDGVTDDKDKCPGTPKGAKVDERGCWVIPGVTFELDKAIVRPLFYTLLDDVVLVLKENPDLKIYVDGHTCDRGTDKHNQALSEKRAKAVQSYLIDKGIDETRLVPRGFGEKNPGFPNDNETNRSKNRRVELTVIEKK